MASTKDYLEYILEQLGNKEEVTFRAMMGEYILYYKGRIFGGIYDNRFLVKPTETARKMMPHAPAELPYEGAKEMLLVEDTDDGNFLQELISQMYEELPEPKKRRKK